MSDTRPHSYAELLGEVQPRPIRSKRDYKQQLEWLERLMGAPANKDTSAMIELLSMTIGAYEAEQFPIPEAAPHVVLDHLLESSGRTSAEIARALGISPTTLSNYRAGRRMLTVDSIRQLADYFRVDPKAFLGAPGPGPSRAQQVRDTLARLDEQVLHELAKLDEWVPAAEVGDRIGMPARLLRASMRRLIARGDVVALGKARGTRYAVAGGKKKK
jgi:HTH-type transcriptional regulator/antitoxin HigA